MIGATPAASGSSAHAGLAACLEVAATATWHASRKQRATNTARGTAANHVMQRNTHCTKRPFPNDDAIYRAHRITRHPRHANTAPHCARRAPTANAAHPPHTARGTITYIFTHIHATHCAPKKGTGRKGAWKEQRRANPRRAQGCPGGNAPGPERHAKPRNGTRRLHHTKHRCALHRATQQAIKHRARTRRAPHFTNRAKTPRQALRTTGDGSGMAAGVMSGKTAARAPGRRRPGSRAEAHRPPHQIPELALHRAAHGDSRDSCDSHRH